MHPALRNFPAALALRQGLGLACQASPQLAGQSHGPQLQNKAICLQQPPQPTSAEENVVFAAPRIWHKGENPSLDFRHCELIPNAGPRTWEFHGRDALAVTATSNPGFNFKGPMLCKLVRMQTWHW